jgi:hypothetical protein
MRIKKLVPPIVPSAPSLGPTPSAVNPVLFSLAAPLLNSKDSSYTFSIQSAPGDEKNPSSSEAVSILAAINANTTTAANNSPCGTIDTLTSQNTPRFPAGSLLANIQQEKPRSLYSDSPTNLSKLPKAPEIRGRSLPAYIPDFELLPPSVILSQSNSENQTPASVVSASTASQLNHISGKPTTKVRVITLLKPHTSNTKSS